MNSIQAIIVLQKLVDKESRSLHDYAEKEGTDLQKANWAKQEIIKVNDAIDCLKQTLHGIISKS